MFYSTESAAQKSAQQLNSNLSPGERQNGSYVHHIHKSGKCWRVVWLAA